MLNNGGPHDAGKIAAEAVNSETGEALNRLIRGFQISSMLRITADLSIADQISPGDRVPVTLLATNCGVFTTPLLRLCRALAAFGIFEVNPDHSIGHSAMSLLLRADSKTDHYLSARFWAARGNWAAWGDLGPALRTSESSHQAVWGMSRFDYMKSHPEEARIYDARMGGASGGRQDAIAAAYDFSKASLLVDVGGGNGALLRAILARYPQPRGIVFDREDVVAAVPADARIQVEHGNFLDRVPAGADHYLLSWILHDWSDEICLQILQNCRREMPLNGRLIIAERVLDPNPAHGNPMDYLSDIQMMTIGGQERTIPEFQTLLTSAKFGAITVYPTTSPVSVLEAAPL